MNWNKKIYWRDYIFIFSIPNSEKKYRVEILNENGQKKTL